MSRARRCTALILGILAIGVTVGCESTGDAPIVKKRSFGAGLEARWEPIAAAESQISISDSPRVLQRRAQRNKASGMYTEVMGMPNGSMLYEKRRIPGRSLARAADRELRRRWEADAALKAAGIQLGEVQIERRAVKDGTLQIAVADARGSDRSCSVFFRYSPKTQLDPAGAPVSRYEAITGVICEPQRAGAGAAARTSALNLASNVAFDGGRAAQEALFRSLLEGNREQLLNEDLLEGKDKAGAAPPPPSQPARRPSGRTMNGVPIPRFHALVLGAENYPGPIPRLDTPGNDARKVSALLRDHYGFEVRTVIDPHKSDIVRALADYSRTLGSNDSLLIYYAGHGFLDKRDGQGYWLPIGQPTSVVDTWISNKALASAIRSVKAGHVMVVSDACFSGSLVGERGKKIGSGGGSLKEWIDLRARTALASGNLELVDDDAGNGHSPFATSFLALLQRNQGLMSGQQLSVLVSNFVKRISEQSPQYGLIIETGHQPGADFFFVPVTNSTTGS